MDERVSDRELEPIGRAIAEVDRYFGDDSKTVVRLPADIRRLGEQVAGHRQSVLAQYPIDIENLTHVAHRYLAGNAQGKPSRIDLAGKPYLASMESIGRIEAVETGQRDIGERLQGADRSEERRVGKECRSRWSP